MMDGDFAELHRFWEAGAYPGKLWTADDNSRPLSVLQGLLAPGMHRVYPSLGRCILATMLANFSYRARWYYPAEPRAGATSEMTVFVFGGMLDEHSATEFAARMHISYRASVGSASAFIFSSDERYASIEVDRCEALDGVWDVVLKVLREMFSRRFGERGMAAQHSS
jgi:hypothetical protein